MLKLLRVQIVVSSLFVPFLLGVEEEPVSVSLKDVEGSVERFYPPFLATLIELDLADSRVRQAVGTFDSTFSLSATARPRNYYDGSDYEFIWERPFKTGGGSFYAGYRYSNGFLPDYKRHIRTAAGGEWIVGLNLPLLKDRKIDKRRAQLKKSEIDREMARPSVVLLQMELIRSARVAYYQWVASSRQVEASIQLLEVAKERQGILQIEVDAGARPELVLLENKQAIIQRQLAVNRAQRLSRQAAIKLSLYFRDLDSAKPILLENGQYYSDWSVKNEAVLAAFEKDLKKVQNKHPKLRKMTLLQKRQDITIELAKNGLQPNLFFSVELNRQIGGGIPDDIDETELETLLKYNIPLGRNEAKGKVAEAEAELERLKINTNYAREELVASLKAAKAALQESQAGIELATTNYEVAEELLDAEQLRFDHGASDLLLVLQRERLLFEAALSKIEVKRNYGVSHANYLMAAARDNGRTEKLKP